MMFTEPTVLASWGYGLAAAAYAVFALYLLRAWHGGWAGGLLLAAVSAGMGWALLAAWLAAGGPQGLVPALAGMEGLRVAGWYGFVLALLALSGVRVVLWRGVAAVMVMLMLAFAWLPFASWPGEAAARPGLLVFLSGAVLGLVLVEQLFRALPPESRWGVKPLCLGLAAGWMFELYYFADAFLFARPDADLWSVRGLVHAMTIPLIALSAARNPAWKLQMAMSRQVVFHSTALAVAGAYLLVIAAAGYYVRYLGGDWGRALQVALLFAGLLLLSVFIGSGASRARLRVLLDKHLFPYRYDYRAEWLRFTQALSVAGRLDLGQSVIKALSDLVESPAGALWLRAPDGRFVQHSRLNMPPCDAAEPADGALCRFLDEREWVVDIAEFRMRRARYPDLELPQWLLRLEDAWLLVPLKTGDGLLGFVLLCSPRAPFEIDWEVRDLLKTAQRQAASYLARMQAAEALLEARKFDAFNRMSAFVVHDLKNLVAQLALMLRNAERHRDNPAFQQDMLETVAHVEARMRALMAQLQEKRPIDGVRPLDPLALLERVLSARRSARLALRVSPQGGNLPQLAAHAERLERVLGHLVQNALDATGQAGNVTVELREEADGFLAIDVLDSGCGMSAEFIRERLSRPFQTTKDGGMGLGVYETSQYIRELGGSLSYDSAPGQGTRAQVRLPVWRRDGRVPQAADASVPATVQRP